MHLLVLIMYGMGGRSIGMSLSKLPEKPTISHTLLYTQIHPNTS
jgi:hypothetical protein